MRHPPLAPGWIDRPHREALIGDLPLESGDILRDCRMVWVEHGERNEAGDNSVLVCCAIGSTHHRLDFLIGEGRALDTRRFHVVAIDALGNGLSSSPSNSTSQPGVRFPALAIRDMVESQRRLLELLGISRLHAVIGASMGGMQALQWAVSFPGKAARIVAMTAMARTARWSQLMNELGRRALFEDAAFTRPRERASAMRLWAPLTQLLVSSTPAAAERFPDAAALLDEIDALESRLVEHGPDPFDWACQSRAYDAHDLGTSSGFGGDTDGALRAIAVPTLLIAPPLDLYNPAQASHDMAGKIPHARRVEIPSTAGHRAATDTRAEDAAFLNGVIGGFLR
ncbi:MAG TPA: alpha/beta fold hydrolase [Usitatibacter sp.]|jgi:homoserine O-acetyltransferase|nr:alpha/beta fold hydrolase [Usitatibacter sp.]